MKSLGKCFLRVMNQAALRWKTTFWFNVVGVYIAVFFLFILFYLFLDWFLLFPNDNGYKSSQYPSASDLRQKISDHRGWWQNSSAGTHTVHLHIWEKHTMKVQEGHMSFPFVMWPSRRIFPMAHCHLSHESNPIETSERKCNVLGIIRKQLQSLGVQVESLGKEVKILCYWCLSSIIEKVGSTVCSHLFLIMCHYSLSSALTSVLLNLLRKCYVNNPNEYFYHYDVRGK